MDFLLFEALTRARLVPAEPKLLSPESACCDALDGLRTRELRRGTGVYSLGASSGIFFAV